ncbi:hypothetical protein ACWCQL_20710 [Streptomyces sp. NPDC002073]
MGHRQLPGTGRTPKQLGLITVLAADVFWSMTTGWSSDRAAQETLRRITGLEPAAGYSAFVELRTPQEGFLPWVVRCGRAGLRLNPTVVHGGTSAAWDSLYPGGQLLRVTLSENPSAFLQGLNRLSHRAHRSAPGQGLRADRASP